MRTLHVAKSVSLSNQTVNKVSEWMNRYGTNFSETIEQLISIASVDEAQFNRIKEFQEHLAKLGDQMSFKEAMARLVNIGFEIWQTRLEQGNVQSH